MSPRGNQLSWPTANQPCSLTLITQIVFPLKGFQMATFFPIAKPLFCKVLPVASAYLLMMLFLIKRHEGKSPGLI